MATPAERKRLIRQATLKGRKSWEAYTKTQRAEIYKLFYETSRQIESVILRYQLEGEIPPIRLNTLYKEINNELAILRPKLHRRIIQGMRKSVDLGIESSIFGMKYLADDYNVKYMVGTSYIGKDGIIRTHEAATELYQDSAWAKINGNAMDALLRFSPDGITLSDRVWNISFETEKKIKQLVTKGVMIGDPPAQIARDIKGYLLEPDKVFRRVRNEAGKLVPSQRALQYHPGRGVYRSSFQNAYRTARTEYARAYHEGTIRYAESRSWCDGYISRTTSGNPAPYDASVDGFFFPKDNPPNIPYHPNCMCYAELHFVADGRSELAKTPDNLEEPIPKRQPSRKNQRPIKEPSLKK